MVMEDPLTWIFVVTVALATALALIAVRGNLSIVARAGALGLTAMLLLTSYNGFTELMSRPKPATLEWVDLTYTAAGGWTTAAGATLSIWAIH